ncbi:MAG: HD-GYP domain-containing protein [Planctomycetes bacterium]|nr:HD-GYP domain-containing protein [Planctomycetota bacterium]
MPPSLTTTLPAKPLTVPKGLVEGVRARTGVAVHLFDLQGAPLAGGAGVADGPAGPADVETLSLLARAAIADDADQGDETPAGLAAAWPIRIRGKPVLVAAAELDLGGAADTAVGRQCLAAVAEAVRARFDEAERTRECDSLTEALTQSFEEISLLHNVGEVLRVTRPIGGLLEYLCAELCEITGAEAAAAYVPDASGGEANIVVRGDLPLAEQDLPALFGHVAETAAEHVLINNHCQEDPALAAFSPHLRQMAVVPLDLGDGPPGALAILNRAGADFDSPEVKLIRSSAGAGAVFIENRRLYNELQAMMLDLVRALVSSVDAKDPYTCGHSERVALTAHALACEMGLPDDQVEQAYMAGLLHDIGKIGTPEAILSKEGRLAPDERRIVAEHPGIGGRIIHGIRKLETIREAVIHHHERIDGSGYPDNLPGDAIPPLARIVGLADAFDAMTSNRPYRPMLPLDAVIREIEKHNGTQFDPAVVEAFFRLDIENLMDQFAEHAAARRAETKKG